MRQSPPGSPDRTRRGALAVADCGSFAELAKRVSALEALDRALRQTLPLPLRDQVRFADLREQRLVFLATSPAWASRLRLAQAQILASARAIGVCASAVKVKVVTPDIARPQQESLRSLSPAAAAHLRATAGSFKDPELRSMFLALASRAPAATP
ncbi:MAG: DciA family protein [Rhodanobacter sp.]